MTGLEEQTYVSVVTGGTGTLEGHVRSAGGMAECGRPAARDQLFTWGDDRITCARCAQIHGAR